MIAYPLPFRPAPDDALFAADDPLAPLLPLDAVEDYEAAQIDEAKRLLAEVSVRWAQRPTMMTPEDYVAWSMPIRALYRELALIDMQYVTQALSDLA